jgi:GNAT superfamily N-acetyltransferase
MEFELTPEIVDEVVFSMEDQTGRFIFDSSEVRCVPAGSQQGAVGAVFDSSDDRYYSIPSWDSVSGFRMMERFVAQLRNPIAREELRAALAMGQGVFRNFKDILKVNPEIERQWYRFKERSMRAIVLSWYNDLRDYWGLSRVGDEPEETEDIVAEDFTFRAAEGRDEASVRALCEEAELSITEGLSGDLALVVSSLHRGQVAHGVSSASRLVLLAESPEEDAAACAVSCPSGEEGSRAVLLCALAVSPAYRGMGLGKELLDRTARHWARAGFRYLLISSPVVPPHFTQALQRRSFTQLGHVSVLDLSSAEHH